MKQDMPTVQIEALLLQALEHEKGGVEVYQTALRCVQNEDLQDEWDKYLDETRHHVEVLTELCTKLGIDLEQDAPALDVVRHMGESLVMAMTMALESGEPEAAQLVACECVVLAETKDHLNWELIGKCGESALQGEAAKLFKAAYDEIEDQEDEHLYHTKGWLRELWIDSLGMKAILPPPEEAKHVKTAIGAARAEMATAKRR